MKHEARFWKPGEYKKAQCLLCAHTCVIPEDKTGICSVRKNEDGTLVSLIYAACSSVAVDPVEKKPLYHFFPGSRVLSFGSVGCNFKCEHCQNYDISTAQVSESDLQDILPKEAVSLAKQYGCRGLAWTYNEPTIWHEYCFDTAKLAKQEGLYTSYVTNGYITEEPLNELAPYLDAMNIDVKAFTEKFYETVCKARLEPVLLTCERAYHLGIHIELTYLVIPGLNDAEKEINEFCSWVVRSLGPEVPVHFSRFHPEYKTVKIPATPLKTLKQCYDIATRHGLLFVYVGNVPHGDYENTICPQCKHTVIERHGFQTVICGLKDGKCMFCGRVILKK